MNKYLDKQNANPSMPRDRCGKFFTSIRDIFLLLAEKGQISSCTPKSWYQTGWNSTKGWAMIFWKDAAFSSRLHLKWRQSAAYQGISLNLGRALPPMETHVPDRGVGKSVLLTHWARAESLGLCQGGRAIQVSTGTELVSLPTSPHGACPPFRTAVWTLGPYRAPYTLESLNKEWGWKWPSSPTVEKSTRVLIFPSIVASFCYKSAGGRFSLLLFETYSYI